MVKIFSSLSQKPIIDIIPTLPDIYEKNPIFLAYTKADDDAIPAHYDGCVKVELIDIEKIPEEPTQDQVANDKEHKTPVKKRKAGRPKGTPQKK